MKSHSFFSLLFSCFPFVREYRLRKKMQMKRRRMRSQIHKENNKHLKRYLMLSQGIRRS